MDYSHSKASKVLKKAKKYLRNNRYPLLLIFIGLAVFSAGALNYYRVRILSFDKVPPEAQAMAQKENMPSEIIIPSINIDLKVDPGEIKNGVWQISQHNATFLTTSAPPGTGDNTVIYGHNKKVIFGNLPYLSTGQKIILKTQNGDIYNYTVTQKYFVDPGRVDLISPSGKPELTIYTCWGIFDQERAVIKAIPI